METETFMTKEVCQVPIDTAYTEVFPWAFDVEIAFYTQDRALTIPAFS